MEDDSKDKIVLSKFPEAFLDVQVFIDHCLKSQHYSVEHALYLINPNPKYVESTKFEFPNQNKFGRSYCLMYS